MQNNDKIYLLIKFIKNNSNVLIANTVVKWGSLFLAILSKKDNKNNT